ncbi:hypothetical protein ACSTIA_23335, partial [Vibrio parahaemolyticus]
GGGGGRGGIVGAMSDKGYVKLWFEVNNDICSQITLKQKNKNKPKQKKNLLQMVVGWRRIFFFFLSIKKN